MTFNIQPGDICVLPFPFTDLTTHKKRPALALSSPDDYGDIRFAFITTKPGQKSTSIKIEALDYLMDCQPLPRESFLRLEKQYLLNKSLVLSKKTALNTIKLEEILRRNVIKEITPYCVNKYQDTCFLPGVTPVPVSGKVIGEQEIAAITESALDGWLTTGRFNRAFEKKLAEFIGTKHVLTVNSGSSANLLAVAALTSHKHGDRALRPGDEVITVAAGFPTTVNPLLHYGLVPVFVDIELPSYNIDVRQIQAAITSKTKAIMLAHTLGNPFNLDVVTSLARQYRLWLIEDCCDALGSFYVPGQDLQDAQGKLVPAGQMQHVGTFGDIGTLSFYPAHQITMGEGGAVFTQNGQLKRIIESFRDWGRDCYCEPGRDNTCRKRFGYQLGELPYGYDHKYTYSHLGYNLKITDMQAAAGLAQLQRLPEFVTSRRRNFQYLRQGLDALSDHLILPEATSDVEPSWFGFTITLKQNIRRELIAFLQQRNIDSRLIFAGNLIRQPYFSDRNYRVIGQLSVTDQVMNNALWLGCYPGLTDTMLDYMIESITEFFIGEP